MAEYCSAENLLEMFSVDCKRKGAQDFIELAELLGLCLAFPEYEVNDHLLVRTLLSQKKLSPLVYWGRMKRDLLPILTADSDVLDNLGCALPESRTSAELARVVGRALADNMLDEGREKYRVIALQVAEQCGKRGREEWK